MDIFKWFFNFIITGRGGGTKLFECFGDNFFKSFFGDGFFSRIHNKNC